MAVLCPKTGNGDHRRRSGTFHGNVSKQSGDQIAHGSKRYDEEDDDGDDDDDDINDDIAELPVLPSLATVASMIKDGYLEFVGEEGVDGGYFYEQVISSNVAVFKHLREALGGRTEIVTSFSYDDLIRRLSGGAAAACGLPTYYAENIVNSG